MYLRGVPPFPCDGYHSSLLLVFSVEKIEVCPRLDFSELSAPLPDFSVNVAVYARRLIPFDTIVAS